MTMEDLRKIHTAFSVPVFFIQGEDDNITPTVAWWPPFPKSRRP